MSAAIDCNWGKAKLGDIIGLPAPFGFVPEAVGVLRKIDQLSTTKAVLHTYDLYLLAIWFGRAQAKFDGKTTEWRVIE